MGADVDVRFTTDEVTLLDKVRGPLNRRDYTHRSTMEAVRATTTPQPPTSPVPLGPSGIWRPILSEEFAGDALNTNLWNTLNGAYNGSEQVYRPSQVVVSGGTCKLNAAVVNGQILSGFLTTRAQNGSMKFKYTHGFIETRQRITGFGPPAWPAIWLVGPNDGSSPSWPDYGEYDVMEGYGPAPLSPESNFHYGPGPDDHNIGGTPHQLTTPLSEWHTFGFNWTDKVLEWWYDGVLVRSFTPKTVDQIETLAYPHSIDVNLAIGGAGPEWYGYVGPANKYLPMTMEVEYVRVWQQ